MESGTHSSPIGTASRGLSKASRTFRHPSVRELFFWCLPALLLGLVLRIMLTVHLPFAYYHDDTADFLTTPDRLLHDHKFELHEKKTFLPSLVITAPFVLGVPALRTVPIVLHVLGLFSVVAVGILCRLWMSQWKLWIIPVTLLMAANPFLLWYEHTLMAESFLVAATLWSAIAGTFYTRKRSLSRFVFLLTTLVLCAGSRPEGKLFFGFGLLLLLVIHARTLRTAWPRLLVFIAIAGVTSSLTRTGQTGLLLYTSVASMTPSDLKCAPGFDPYIGTLRKELKDRWDTTQQFPRVSHRKEIIEIVRRYRQTKSGEDAFCFKLARETCLKNIGSLPALCFYKFSTVSNEEPGGWLNNEWLFEQQQEAYLGGGKRTLLLAEGLTGEAIPDQSALIKFFETQYGEVPWFNQLQRTWLAWANALRFSDKQFPDPDHQGRWIDAPGLPLYFLFATLGLIAIALRRGQLQRFHIAWGLALLGFFFVVILTGNVRARFRLVFEPFWFVYLFALLDCLWTTAAHAFRRLKPVVSIPD